MKDKRTASAWRLTQQLLNDFITKSDIALAIFDEHLRYQAVNPWLATRIGLAVELNVGKHLKEVMSEVATRLEPALRAAVISGQPIVNFETEAPLPIKREGKHWMVNVFPAKDAQGNVKQIAAIFVEVRTADSEPGTTAGAIPNVELLRSWKEIASYMGTCVKTVQRWERIHDLPIRRVTRKRGAVVFALRSELENWMRSHPAKKAADQEW